MPLVARRLTLWPLEIPLRTRFRHAAAQREAARPIVAQVELSDGTIGFGETHPRPYVSGETEATVLEALHGLLLPRVADIRAERFPEALEAIDALPLVDEAGRPLTAARAALELALLDAFSRAMRRPMDEIAGWLGVAGLGPPGSGDLRYSGVLGAEEPQRVSRSIRRMRCFGLRDFKLKVGDDGDDARVRAALVALGGAPGRGAATLRLDANGAWTVEQARERLAAWADLPIACVEQPLPRGGAAGLRELQARSPVPLMADESVVTPDDAEDLIVHEAVGAFNIRLSKNGGLLPAIRLALLARRHRLRFQLGCMVGETSILSAAGQWFLRLVPGVWFAEGGYGRFLLRGDVTRRTVRFGLGGRARLPEGPGWGVEVDERLLRRWCPDGPIPLPL